MQRRVLVVEDDDTVAEVIVGYLERAGFAVERTADGEDALARASRDVPASLPDLVVLDVMLPGLDGIEVCRRLRELGPVPVLMLTALGEEEDRIAGLEVGADDYMTKPFSPRELVLRVESVLRRAQSAPWGTSDGATPTGVLRASDVVLDQVAHRVTRAGRELALTAREFDLLAFLLAHPGQAFSRDELLQQVWGWAYGDRSTVTVHIRRLREKVEDTPADPRLVVTVWGVGYRLDAAASPVEVVEVGDA